MQKGHNLKGFRIVVNFAADINAEVACHVGTWHIKLRRRTKQNCFLERCHAQRPVHKLVPISFLSFFAYFASLPWHAFNLCTP